MESLLEIPRFNHDATTVEEAVNYMQNRAKQLLKHDYFITKIDTFEWGISAYFTNKGILYQSIYILEGYRGKGLYKSVVTDRILTSYECDIEDYLHSQGIKYVIEGLRPSHEYGLVSSYYGDQKAKRTGVYLMNHIDEGLAILEWIGASETAKKAYCLHPIFQNDTDLFKNYSKPLTNVNGQALIAVMEYRAIANAYLSNRHIENLDEIKTSILTDVNDMLIADKIQNRKDFELYHKDTHPRSKELQYYFMNWMAVLGITEDQYQDFKNKLS